VEGIGVNVGAGVGMGTQCLETIHVSSADFFFFSKKSRTGSSWQHETSSHVRKKVTTRRGRMRLESSDEIPSTARDAYGGML